MAGAGHRPATGLNERTLGRIDLILFDADYPDARAAVEDAWRVAVLASDPRMRADHERARAEAVRAANERRDPVSARVRTSTALHRAALGAAFVLGTVAVALIATPRSRSASPAGRLAARGDPCRRFSVAAVVARAAPRERVALGFAGSRGDPPHLRDAVAARPQPAS